MSGSVAVGSPAIVTFTTPTGPVSLKMSFGTDGTYGGSGSIPIGTGTAQAGVSYAPNTNTLTISVGGGVSLGSVFSMNLKIAPTISYTDANGVNMNTTVGVTVGALCAQIGVSTSLLDAASALMNLILPYRAVFDSDGIARSITVPDLPFTDQETRGFDRDSSISLDPAQSPLTVTSALFSASGEQTSLAALALNGATLNVDDFQDSGEAETLYAVNGSTISSSNPNATAYAVGQNNQVILNSGGSAGVTDGGDSSISGNNLQIIPGNCTVAVNGDDNHVTGTTGSQITLENTGASGDTVTGDNLTITAGQGANANITGTGDIVSENGSGGSIGVFNDGTSADTVILNGSDKTTNVQTDQADPTDGSVSVTVTGDRDYVGLLGNSGYTVSLSNGQIETWNGTSFSATGTGDTIGTGNGETITLNGSGNTLSAGSNVTLTDFCSGDIDTVGAGSNGYINNAHDMLTKGTGSYAAFQVGYDAGTASGTGGFNLVGPNETATVADASYIGVVAGPGDTAHINDGTVTTLDGVGFKLVGTGDSVSAQRPHGWHRIAA